MLGPGGVGAFVAAALARAGTSADADADADDGANADADAASRANDDVTVVAREPTAALIAERGIEVQSRVLGSFTARPHCTPRLVEPVDVLLVATKATGLDAALERVAAEPGLIVPLLNGLEHMARLRGRFGAGQVAAGVIRIESDRPAPGKIVQTSPGVRVDLASDDPALAQPVAELAGAVRAAGLDVLIGASERQILWSKLARLNALALTTSASDRPIGFVRTDPRWRSALEGAVAETAAVANADGATIDPAATLAELDGGPRRTRLIDAARHRRRARARARRDRRRGAAGRRTPSGAAARRSPG